MKRTWIGLALLVTLLAGCLLAGWGMARCMDPVADALKQAGQAAMEEDWQRAAALAEDARRRWGACREFTAVFADHEPMEAIDALFEQLKIYEAARAQTDFAAGCASLSRQVEAMGQAHTPAWWNIL